MASTNGPTHNRVSTRTPPLVDGCGREIGYIRVSVIDQCNYSCLFCKPVKAAEQCRRVVQRLSVDEIVRLCGILSRMGIDNFKITGGEPMLHLDILAILGRLKNEVGAGCVTVTTNGSTLRHHAEPIQDIGVDGINVSLNAVSPEGYRTVTASRFGADAILDSILHAHRIGLNIKLNMVPIKGVNEDEILPVVDFALRHGIYLRFIELMPVGLGKRHVGMSCEEVMALLARRYGKVEQIAERFGNGPAVYYAVGSERARIGYIAALSKKFCSTCNRIRLASDGFLRTCLHHNHGVSLGPLLAVGSDDAALEQAIRSAIADKPSGHELESDRPDSALAAPMFRIGG